MDNRIGITIEGTNNSIAAFQRLKGDLDAVAIAAQTVTKSQREMSMQGRDATTQNRALSSTVKATNTAFRRNAVVTRQSRVAIQRWGAQADRASRAGGRYAQSAELAAVALGLAARNTTALARAQIQGAANLERLLIGLDAITGSLDAANAQYRDLIEVSRLPGINIENSLRATLQLQALGKTGEESTRIIRGFGNALALSGRPPRELGQVINAIRQMSGEGKILQEDIAIITTRIASLIPLMQEAFGGTRAEDVRKFYDALGTPPSQQAELFLEVMLEGLERLPRAGETAANAIENLFDTAGRVQARIGSNFLPVVKEATAAIEGALMSIERSPTAARNIASLEAFAGGLLGVTAAAAGLQAAIRFLGPSLLAFATGPVGIAAAAAGAAAGAYLAWEVNLTSATEAQLKSLETEKTRLQLFREAQGLIAAGDTTQLATREDALSKSVAAANTAYERQVSVVEEARQALEAYNRQTEQLEESPGARSARSAERGALALRDPSQLEEGLREAEARLNALNRARLAANRIAADAAALVATAQTAVVTPSDTLDTQIDALAQSATEGSTAIARALQSIQNIDANTGETGLARQQDIALDIGDQLVAIAEATTVKQLDAAKRRVAGLARDNSLIIENETGLQNLLLAAESQFRERKIALITAAGKEAASERIRQEVEAEREASAQGLIERQRAAQRAREQARRATTQLLTQSNDQIGDVLSQLRDADISDDQFASLNVQFETMVMNLDNLGVAIPNIGRLREELAGIADLRIDDQLSGLAEATQRNQEAAFAGAREAGEQLTRNLLEGGEAVQREFARKRIQATRQVVRQIERIETGLARAQSVDSLERLQTDTRQLRSELQQRGRAWQAHTDRVTALSRDISDSLDEALRTERLENFQDAVANVVSDLANTGFDFIFDSIFDRASSATDKIKTFTDDVRGDIQLLESDIRRLTRFDEDRELGAARLEEDRDRAVRNLQFRLRETAGQQIFGDQRALQRNIERQQDIRFRLRERREDFDVRLGRFGEDTALRRNRLVDDATRNRERAEAPGDQKGFLERLGRRITDSISAALSDKIGNFIASALTSALPGLLGGLFGGGEDGEPTGLKLDVPTDGLKLNTPTDGLKLDTPTDGLKLDLKGALSAVTTATDADLPTITGLEGTLSEVVLQETAKLPSVPGLKGGLSNVVIQMNATLPIVPGLVGGISSVAFDADIDFPNFPAQALNISSITFADNVTLPQLESQALMISSVAFDADIDFPNFPAQALNISSITFAEDVGLPALDAQELLINSVKFAEGVTPPALPIYNALIGSISLAQGVASLALDVKGVITSIALQTGIAAPSLDGLTGLITNLALAEGVAAPALNNYDVLINSVAFSEDIDYPNLPSYEATIGSISFAEGVAFTLPDSVVINSIAFAEGVDFPSIPQQELIIASVAFAEGVTAPSIGGIAGVVSRLTVDATTPALAGIAGTISELALAAGEDAPNPPSVDGIAGIIDSLTLDPSITLPTIRIPAVVGAVTGGGGEGGGSPFRGAAEEDPENPIIGTQDVDGVINASLNRLFTEPVQIAGIINARVRTVGDAGGQGDAAQADGGADNAAVEDLEEAVTNNYSAVEDLNTNIKQLNDSVKNVSTNLDPALGATPLIDLPSALDRLLEQTGTASPTAERQFPGFGEALGAHSQFRPGGGGGGAAQQGAALRVNLPTEFFVGLVNIHTELAAQTKQFESINTHLADLRIGLFGAEPLKVQIVQGAVESGGIDPIVGVRAILANFENRGIPIRTEGGEDFFGGFNFADLAPAKLIEASQVTPLITSDQETIKGLQTLNELMAQQVVSRGDEENPLYITTKDPLPVEVTNKTLSMTGDVKIVNEEPIDVQTGVVTVVIGSTPVSVQISDLGSLISQLSAGNTAQDSFGGQTI